ncbi:MAG: hypothetical protein R3A44_09380 [Caldilineaceae bacterium]
MNTTDSASAAAYQTNPLHLPSYRQFSSASITPDATGAGALIWGGDSAAGTGSLLSQLPLGPGASFVITVEFVAMKP